MIYDLNNEIKRLNALKNTFSINFTIYVKSINTPKYITEDCKYIDGCFKQSVVERPIFKPFIFDLTIINKPSPLN